MDCKINNAHQWQYSLNVVFSMEKKEFKECFGDANWQYLWDQFCNRDTHGFIAYLDAKNIEKLYNYVMSREDVKKYGNLS